MDLPLYLKNRMANRQLSHAYLVVGENRRELAQTLAAAWVCTGDKPPCGQCSGCRKAAAGIHPDIIRADPDGDGLKAEAVRALRSDAYIRPNEAPKKVYVLEHAELLNATGQNILLKLIEEGPEYACFLFLSPNPELLLETIRSRCVRTKITQTLKRMQTMYFIFQIQAGHLQVYLQRFRCSFLLIMWRWPRAAMWISREIWQNP